MALLEEKKILTDYLDIDPSTGEILTPIKWTVIKNSNGEIVEKRYFPTSKGALSIWELHLIEGTKQLRRWANESAKKRGYR